MQKTTLATKIEFFSQSLNKLNCAVIQEANK